MANVLDKLFTPVQLANAAGTPQYTSPITPPTRTKLTKITVCNTTGGAVTVTAEIIIYGGAAATKYKVYDAYSIAANSQEELFLLAGHVLQPGDFLDIFASAATSISCSGAGLKMT